MSKPATSKSLLILSVELLGFEPRQTEPKSVVLPLHHSSIAKRSAKIEVQEYAAKFISNFLLLFLRIVDTPYSILTDWLTVR